MMYVDQSAIAAI